MFVEITIELQNDDFEAFDDKKERMLQVSSTKEGGIVIGAIDTDGELLDGYFETLGKKETIELRDFLNYLTHNKQT